MNVHGHSLFSVAAYGTPPTHTLLTLSGALTPFGDLHNYKPPAPPFTPQYPPPPRPIPAATPVGRCQQERQQQQQQQEVAASLRSSLDALEACGVQAGVKEEAAQVVAAPAVAVVDAQDVAEVVAAATAVDAEGFSLSVLPGGVSVCSFRKAGATAGLATATGPTTAAGGRSSSSRGLVNGGGNEGVVNWGGSSKGRVGAASGLEDISGPGQQGSSGSGGSGSGGVQGGSGSSSSMLGLTASHPIMTTLLQPGPTGQLPHPGVAVGAAQQQEAATATRGEREVNSHSSMERGLISSHPVSLAHASAAARRSVCDTLRSYELPLCEGGDAGDLLSHPVQVISKGWEGRREGGGKGGTWAMRGTC